MLFLFHHVLLVLKLLYNIKGQKKYLLVPFYNINFVYLYNFYKKNLENY